MVPYYLAFAQRKIVDAEVARRGSWGYRLLPSEAKERIGADCHPLASGKTSAGFAADIEAKMTLFAREAYRTAGRARGECGNRLGKRPSRAVLIVTKEAPDVEMKPQRGLGQRQVGQGTSVLAVDATGITLAGGARCTGSGR